MVKLSVYRAPIVDEEPRILSFAELAPQVKVQRRVDAAHKLTIRCRVERQNRVCPVCDRITAAPIELCDGLLSRNGSLIPGSATIVGFHCSSCGHEWPAQSPD